MKSISPDQVINMLANNLEVNNAPFNLHNLSSDTLSLSKNVYNSVTDARAELLQLLVPFDVADRKSRIENIVDYLESRHVPIHTADFFQLAVGGEWKLMYTNSYNPLADPNLQMRYSQIILHDGQSGKLKNILHWKTDDGNGESYTGELHVDSGYKLTSKGIMSVALEEHRLHADMSPDHAESLIMAIQRTVPIELFDPDECSIETTYVDPQIRIVRVTVPRLFAPVINIYSRSL